MKEEIKEKVFDKTWKKVIITFVIIFVVILAGGILSINYLHDAITNHHIHSENINVSDKIQNENSYTVFSNNKTYCIKNDKYGAQIFNKIDVGRSYRVIVKEPELMDINQTPIIMQVYNVTG